ncbi:response regulator [Rubrolithibacter danxiaensis]|uniref:response regulator n=1 Tax=Rubrolithibacter danxiaensis TaxID=3390805 RepID=UPI003BF7A565
MFTFVEPINHTALLSGVYYLIRPINEFMDKRILIVDDDPDILNVLKEAFQYEEYEVKALDSVDNIVNVLNSYQPDLILIDYILNGINGGEICHQIKTMREYQNIPVFLMSAYPKVILSLGTYNADFLVEKPFDLYELLKKVEEKITSKQNSLNQ